MKTRFFSLLIIGGTIAFASCQGSGDGTTTDGDTTATIEKAPDNTKATEPAATTFDDKTRDFAIEATSSGMKEVEASKLAQEKATHQNVKDYAAMIVKDHTKAGEDLKTAVGTKATLPAALTEKEQKQVNDLKDETGKEFEREYIKQMIDDHETAIKKFEDIAKETTDPAIRDFANNTLPALRTHLAEAKSIRDELSKMKK